MLGLSAPKLLLFILLIALVWAGTRYVRRVEAIRRAVRDELLRRHQQQQQQNKGPAPLQAEDLVKCSRCGAYVAARSSTSCGRPDCPWGR